MARTALGLLLGALIATGALGLGTTVIEGDVYIQLMAPVYNDIYENGTCFNIASESVQNVEAIRWLLAKLNSYNYFNWGQKGIGLKVIPTCGSKVEAENLAVELSEELRMQGSNLMGLLGPGSSSEAETVSRLLSALPEQYRLLQISYTATSASLRNRDIYKNFFRTIPPDDVQAQAVTEFVQSVDWTYMAIIYDDDAYGRGGYDLLINNITSRDVCFPIIIPVPVEINYDLQYLENHIRDKMINDSVPVEGAIVFGSYTLASSVLTATTNILKDFPNVTRPAFLFSEAGGYLEGRDDDISKGIFVLSPPKKVMDSFQTHWRGLFTSVQDIYDLPKDYGKWLMDVYKERFGCELPEASTDNACPVLSDLEVEERIPSSVYNQYAIQASLTMAKVIKTVHERRCILPAICNSFLNAGRVDFVDIAYDIHVDFDNDFGSLRLREFQHPSLTISFTAKGEVILPVAFPLYEIYNHQLCTRGNMCLVKIANLGSTGMEVFFNQIKDYDSNGNELTWPDIRKPQCPSTYKCISCLSYTRTDTSVFFKPGDMYVVGVVPVHNPGATPLQCESIKSGALDIVEVIRFAVSDARNIHAEKIPKGDIGIIILDSCNDQSVIQVKMLNLLSNGVKKDGVYIPVADKIIGYIGGWSSSVSTVMADITSRTNYVQISYASTAVSLSDMQRFPYFMRTPTQDNFQADTMLKIVKSVGSNLVQIVYSDGTYGEEGRDTLLRLVDHYKICVAGVHSVTDKTDAIELVKALRTFSSARIILFFVSSFHAAFHLKRIHDLLIPGEFVFIASEGWGTRLNMTGYRNLIGSITLTSELSINDKFKDHMKNLKPDGTNSDPWIREYMEKIFQCNFQWSYNKLSGKPCLGTERLDVYTTDYTLDAWSSFAERAVIALLQGAKSALDDQCGGSTAVCDAFNNNPATLFNFMKVLEFTSESGVAKTRAFNDNGDGTAGYKIYAVGPNERYILVGSSELNGEETDVNFQRSSYPGPSNISSACTDSSICKECVPSHSPPLVSEDNECVCVDLIVVVIILAVICCVLIGILLFVCIRLCCCLRQENGNASLNEKYITPVYWLQCKSAGIHVPEHQENYSSIDDMNHHRSRASDNSYSRRPAMDDIGAVNDTYHSNESFLSSLSSESESGLGSDSSKGGYFQPGSNGDNNQINQVAGMQAVVYQPDGSYVTAPFKESRGFEVDDDDDDKIVSVQSVRRSSADIYKRPPNCVSLFQTN